MLAGGTESMSNAIFYLSDARWGVGTGTTQLKDSHGGPILFPAPGHLWQVQHGYYGRKYCR